MSCPSPCCSFTRILAIAFAISIIIKEAGIICNQAGNNIEGECHLQTVIVYSIMDHNMAKHENARSSGFTATTVLI